MTRIKAKSRRREKAGKSKRKPARKERSLSEIISSLGNEWITAGLQIDAEVFQSRFATLAASRDAWRWNPYLGKYAEQIAANVFGENGIMLRSKIKETEDRVVYSPEDAMAPAKQRDRKTAEFWALLQHERRINRLREWAETKLRRPIEKYRAFKLADALERQNQETIFRGTALIQVGAPDIYANLRVEAGWTEWKRAEFCDVRGLRDYEELCKIRLWSAARDGGHFIRLVKDSAVNKYGLALQHINDEWVDHFYNVDTGTGNIVRLGIEYERTPWGVGKVVAYHFIRRMPRDWQSVRYTSGASYGMRDRVPAESIIHYARFLDTESTRPAPWAMSILGKVKQLDEYEMASVIAARAEACKTGWLYSDLVPEGGVPPNLLPAKGEISEIARKIKVTPGGLYGLPFGVKFMANDPTHPSGNFGEFRQGMGQATCAGLPGADYNVLFNDLAMSFSSGRIGRLDTNEISRMLQKWDIRTAERRIFETWLEMALITGAIDLPYSESKYRKFNKPQFQGRRWKGIDEVKDATAAALRVANHISSLNRENAENSNDFEDITIERAEEIMLQESLGIDPTLTVQSFPVMLAADAEEETGTTPANSPASETDEVDGETSGGNGNGKSRLANGAELAITR